MTANEEPAPAGLRSTRWSALRSALLLVPAAFGLWWGLRLALAAWTIGGFGPGEEQVFDPLVAVLRGGSADTGVTVAHSHLERAARLAVHDPRYAFRIGLRRWREAGEMAAGSGQAEAIRESFAEAVRRAPTDGVLRYYLAEACRMLGRFDDADTQARAALRLAPLNGVVKSRVSRYFLERSSDETGGDLLSSTLRSLEGNAEESTAFLRSRADLSDEALAGIIERADLVPSFALEILGRSGRWELAVNLARSWEQAGRAPPGEEGRARLARAAARLAAGDSAGAREDGEAARAGLGAAFRGGLVLGEARLLTGDVRGGLGALAEAFAAGAPAATVARLTSLEAVPAADAVEFWRRAAVGGAPPARLEHARALLRASRGPEGQDILRLLVEVRETAGEANYLLARSFLLAGSRPMARRYAAEAAAIDPRNEEYRRLLEKVTD